MILTLIKNIWLDDYPRKWGFLLEAISMISMLIVFWYTSQAFTPKEPGDVNYFEYLFWGEFILYIPLNVLAQNVRLAKKLAYRKTFDFFLVREISIPVLFLKNGISHGLWALMKMLFFLIFSILFFSLDVSPLSLMTLIGFISIQSLFCSLLGMAIGLIVIFTGRGEGLWGQLTSFLSLFAGAYFPLKVLPPWLREISTSLNFITAYLEQGRALVYSKVSYELWPILCVWWLVIVMFLGIVSKFGLRYYKKHGPPSDITI